MMPTESEPVQSDIHMRDRAATRPDTKHSEEAHQTSSPLMAASSDLKGNYDVFLSFRGTDVRKSFLSHFYAALAQKGIHSYVDSEELRKGDCIKPALMKAIEESCIAIIIFSEDYASSPWCLEEVEKIMECKEQRGLTVLPVFYKVDPREVRTPRGNYREAMVKHENKFGRDSEKVKRWEKALLDAGSLSGWEFKDKDEAEADLIKRIVQEISMQLDRTPLHVAKHPVGIPRQVVKLKSMLNLESRDDVLMIGLWGQGGIGKTTLAKALYNDIFRGFEAPCFLANVCETSKDSKDLVHLQEKLLSELVRKDLTVSSVDGGINLIQQRLCRKRVLLVLDDVDHVKQLNALAGGREWFGKGSRIIITTRDNHLLTVHRIDEDHIYEVKTLWYREALELFNKHAFPGSKEIVIRRDLVDRALHYANGLPLALEVLGCFLCGRREQEWESALNKLDKSPDKTINGVLKLSYDGLEDYAKEIFLDIACFFKGRSIEYIIEVLNSCDFDTTIGVQVLVEKSLITKEWRTVQMHDLIQLMGMDIVKQECHDDPGRRSRIWLFEDVCEVLSGEMGTDAVKAIVLDLPKTEVIYIGPNAFTNMRRLRLLIMINVHNSFQGPVCLPNGLRCFQWPECPSSVLEFPPGPKKLVRLDLCKSNIQVVVDQFKRAWESLDHLSNCGRLHWETILPGEEMPQWLLPNKEGYISFTASKDLYEKFLRLVICVVFRVKEGVEEGNQEDFKLIPYINGRRHHMFSPGSFPLMHSDHVLIQLHAMEQLWGVDPFGPNDSSSFQLGIKAWDGAIVKRCGFRLICKPLEDDLEALNQEYKLLDPSLIYEIWHHDEETTSEEEIPAYLSHLEKRRVGHEDNYQTNSEEDDDIRPKKKQRKDVNKDNSSCADMMADFSVERGINHEDNYRTSSEEGDDMDDSPPADIMADFSWLDSEDVDSEDDYQSSSEEGDGQSSSEEGDGIDDSPPADIMADFSVEEWRYSEIAPDGILILPGGDMPKEFTIAEGNTISFMFSQHDYDNLLQLVLCVVFTVEDGEKEVFFDIVPHLNGQRRNGLSGSLGSFNSNHMWIQRLKPNVLWGVLEGAVDFHEFDEDCLQFSLTLNVSGGTVKKFGMC